MFWFRISERDKEITGLRNEIDTLKDAVEHQRKKNNVSKSWSEQSFSFYLFTEISCFRIFSNLLLLEIFFLVFLSTILWIAFLGRNIGLMLLENKCFKMNKWKDQFVYFWVLFKMLKLWLLQLLIKNIFKLKCSLLFVKFLFEKISFSNSTF